MKEIEKYVWELSEKASSFLKSEYNIDSFNISNFQSINFYLIDKALNTNKNLFIESFDKELPSISQFPTILAAAISLFFKNYCDDKTEYKIGDVIQGYNGTRGKIIRKEDDNFIVAVPSDGSSRTLTAKQIRKNWIITNADLSNRKVKTKFTAYKELYSSRLVPIKISAVVKC